jgi:transposase-like protein
MSDPIVALWQPDGKSFSWAAFNGLLRERTEEFLNAVLVACQRDCLCAAHYERSASRRGHRNGYYGRSLGTRYGDLALRVPRNRSGGLPQGVFDPFFRRTSELEDSIMDAFGLGMSTRALSRWLETSGLSLSPQGISNVVAQLDASISAWHARPLADYRWRVILLDGMWVRKGREKRVVLVAMGLTGKDEPEIIDYKVATGETEEEWSAFLENLYGRGLEGRGTLLIVSDGAGGIEAAAAENYPGLPHQRCAFHKLSDITARLRDKKRRGAILKEAARVYRAKSRKDAMRRARRWAAKWIGVEPEAVVSFMRGIEKTLVYHDFEPSMWPKIRTNNAMERFLLEMRRRLKTISAYGSEASIDRMFYAALKGLTVRGYPYSSKHQFTHLS